MFGGQSINAFDYAMAEGVRKSFRRVIRDEINRACELCDVQIAGEERFKDKKVVRVPTQIAVKSPNKLIAKLHEVAGK